MDFTNNSITIYEYQTLLCRLEKAEDQVINLKARLIDAQEKLQEYIKKEKECL